MRIRYVIISAAVVAIAAGGFYLSKTSVSERIGVEARKSGSFDLAKLTDFKWDRVYIFSPYERREKICVRLPATWTQCTSSIPPSLSEGDFLLVFALSGKVVHHELHSRRNGDFCRKSCYLQVTLAEAKFNYSAAQNRHLLAQNEP